MSPEDENVQPDIEDKVQALRSLDATLNDISSDMTENGFADLAKDVNSIIVKVNVQIAHIYMEKVKELQSKEGNVENN